MTMTDVVAGLAVYLDAMDRLRAVNVERDPKMED